MLKNLSERCYFSNNKSLFFLRGSIWHQWPWRLKKLKLQGAGMHLHLLRSDPPAAEMPAAAQGSSGNGGRSRPGPSPGPPTALSSHHCLLLSNFIIQVEGCLEIDLCLEIKKDSTSEAQHTPLRDRVRPATALRHAQFCCNISRNQSIALPFGGERLQMFCMFLSFGNHCPMAKFSRWFSPSGVGQMCHRTPRVPPAMYTNEPIVSNVKCSLFNY